MADPIVEQWRSRLKNISSDLMHLAHLDDVFWQVQAVVDQSQVAQRDGTFIKWMGDCYTHAIVTGVRRLVDRTKGTDSLFRLLEEMGRKSATMLTRQSFRETWGEDQAERCDNCFDLLGANGSDHIPASVIDGKLKELHNATVAVVDFANKAVTHRGLKRSILLKTYRQIRESIVGVFLVAQWCETLLTCGTPANPVPIMQGNWLVVFEGPWLESAIHVPKYRHLDELLREAIDRSEGRSTAG